MSFRTVPPRIAVGAILLLVAASRLAVAQSATLSPELQSVRKLLEKYNDPIVAVHDGFYSSVGCISYPNGGGEGAMQ